MVFSGCKRYKIPRGIGNNITAFDNLFLFKYVILIILTVMLKMFEGS